MHILKFKENNKTYMFRQTSVIFSYLMYKAFEVVFIISGQKC